jgi:hypothetical protein
VVPDRPPGTAAVADLVDVVKVRHCVTAHRTSCRSWSSKVRKHRTTLSAVRIQASIAAPAESRDQSAGVLFLDGYRVGVELIERSRD